MRIFTGDRVRLRDGKIVVVTDAPGDRDALHDENETLTWVSKPEWDRGREVVTATMPQETILIGRNIETGGTVVTDMSEVKMVVDTTTLV